MKKLFLLLAFLIIAPNSYAGMGACHDGSGNITELELNANHTYFTTTQNCEYYSLPPTDPAKFARIRNVIKTVPHRYIKWVNEPVEMAPAEKVAVDDALAQQIDLQVRSSAKGQFNGNNETALALRAFAKLVLDEINTLRAQHSLPDRTLSQLKTAIGNAIDNKDVDE